jgi:hypothetical protein
MIKESTMAMRMSMLKFIILLIFTFFFTLTIGACRSSSTTQIEEQARYATDRNSTLADDVANKSAASYITANSIAELTSRASLIVIGQVEQTDRVVNMARDVNDISEPDLSLLGLGQVYQIKVETFIKGEYPDASILFVQPEGFLVKPQMSTEPSPEDVKLARQDDDHIAFISDQRYLLFLHPLRGFEEQQYFTGGIHPWRFNVTDPNHVYPESPAHLLEIPPSNLATVIEQIQKALVVTPEPTVISPLPTPIIIETIVPDKPPAP